VARSLDDAPLSAVDREALERAIELAKAESPAQCKQIDNMLLKDGWGEAAQFAAYACQDRNLKLAPWQMPPVWVRGDPDAILAAPVTGHDHRGLRQAALLLKRLLAAGLSRFEPDPEAALAKAEGKAKVKRGRPAATVPRPINGSRPIEDEDIRH
jgi:hypothetical protein